MKINQTSCVTTYSHVKLLVIHPVQRVTSLDDPVSDLRVNLLEMEPIYATEFHKVRITEVVGTNSIFVIRNDALTKF